MLKGEKRQTLLENLIYLIIWLILFLTPVIDSYYSQAEFDWNEVFRTWRALFPFLGLFILHNYVWVPLLLFRKSYGGYILCLLITVGVIYVFQEQRKPVKPDFLNRQEQREKFPPRPQFEPPREKNLPPDRGPFPEQRRPDFLRMHFMRHAYVNFLFVVFLIIGLNLAVKLLFKSLRDEQRMRELARQNLQTELEYLRHQINPHFFMNTLNNIHALIDIDTEKAKGTVLELSKMMRYLLYDSSQPTLPLRNEIRFLTNYIELMRIRYTDQIEIRISVPDEIPEVQIPPLLFISFIENAFKHGISYQHQSFIHVAMEAKEKELHFSVANRSFNTTGGQPQGIGLENIRKRLQLLYAENYTLEISERNNEYHVLLIIPLPV